MGQYPMGQYPMGQYPMGQYPMGQAIASLSEQIGRIAQFRPSCLLAIW
jgi:hypothetical protein